MSTQSSWDNARIHAYVDGALDYETAARIEADSRSDTAEGDVGEWSVGVAGPPLWHQLLRNGPGHRLPGARYRARCGHGRHVEGRRHGGPARSGVQTRAGDTDLHEGNLEQR